MFFQIDFKSGKPVYLQLVDQVKSASASGVLRPGEALPSIRPLAEELKLNRNTVAKAYGELEHQGLIETHPGRGSVVSGNHSPLKKEIRRKLLERDVDAAVIQAHHLQVPRDEFMQIVSQRLDALEDKQEASLAARGATTP